MLHSKSQCLAFSFVSFIFILCPLFRDHQKNEMAPGDVTADISPSTGSGQILLNKNAVKFVRAYIHENAASLVKIKQRSRVPFITIDRVFSKYHLPVELKYLAVIESELKSTAVSNVGAAGPWQLMPATAKILGLKITGVMDERTQYNASTKAAALYLRDLYNEFGDWLLVIAAYNCGPKPVYTAIHKSRSRNFWNLQAYLPGESRDHVKKFIATHYFFEGKGSVTTLTKAEHVKYCNQMIVWAVNTQARNDSRMTAMPVPQKTGIDRGISYGL